MPSDASIYGMIRPPQAGPGPLELAGQSMQIRNMLDAGQLNALQRQQIEQAMAEDAAVKGAFSGMQPGQTIGDILPQVMRASPKTGVQLQKSHTEQQAAAANLEKTRLETRALQVKQLRDALAGVQDDAGLAMLREATMSIHGPDAVKSFPQSVADPAFAAWREKGLMTAEQFLSQQEAARGRDVTLRGQDVAMRGQDMSAATAREGQRLTETRSAREGDLNRAVTLRGQDLADARARDTSKLTSTQKDDLTSIERSRSTAARLREMFRDEFVGFKGSMGEFWDKYGTQVVPGAEGNQERIQFRSMASDLENQYIKSISGATVPAAEVPRLRRAIPTPSDSPVQYKAKLVEMERNLADLPRIIQTATQPGGAARAAPPAPQTQPAPKDRPSLDHIFGKKKP